VKGYKKDSGWLYRTEGGPNDGHWIRPYSQRRNAATGKWEADNPDWEIPIGDGRYILTPLMLKDGKTRATAKHGGMVHEAFHYVWEPGR
jgi:hypothetical protein